MVKSSMEQNERYDAAEGLVDSDGGHSPSAPSTGQADPASGVARIGPLAPGQRWSVGRKREVVLRLMRGESTEFLSRELGLPIFKLKAMAREGRGRAEGARRRPGQHRVSRRHAAHRRAQHRCRVAAREGRASRPFGLQEVAVMAAVISPASGRRYGIERVCRTWSVPRSGFMPPARRACRAMRRHPAQPGAGRSPPLATRRCSPPSAPISRARHGPARGIARSGPGCAHSTASGSRASGCYA